DGNVTGVYSGISDQVGNVYLETWNNYHPNGTVNGHIDVDNENDGAQPGPNGEGSFLFDESGEIELGGTLTGSVPLVSLQQAVICHRLTQWRLGQRRPERGRRLRKPAEQFAGYCRRLQRLLRQRRCHRSLTDD